MSEPDAAKLLCCANCGMWEYELAAELGLYYTRGYWMKLTGYPAAVGFGDSKAFCSLRCLAEYATCESAVLK